MVIFQKKALKIITVVILVGLIGAACYLLYNYRTQLDQLKKDKETLQSENLSLQKNLTDKNNEIDALKKENETLKQSAANQTKIFAAEPSPAPSAPVSSVYDKVVGDDQFKAKIFAALDLLKAGDNEHFQLVNNQISHIYGLDDYGGKQIKRDIYISIADNDNTTIASVIVHEARHVYTVYVEKIYSYGTKEQELPSYQAELLSAQRLGAPAYFISSVESQIAYWQSQ